jgi:predicted DNA-binding transcriptional regulator YafY
MPKGTNQKLKLFYLIKIMQEKTDEDHALTMPEILKELEAYGVTAERKSIYNDFAAMEELGIEVVGEQVGKTYYYRMVSRKFEMAELKLLVDAIQASKFITAKKSNELIKKLESLASHYEAGQLQRQVYVSGRIKTMNESIYYTVDYIHAAISRDAKISFKYFEWTAQKEKVLKHDGKDYVISPWALTWDDENYYLVAYDSQASLIKHYRVDKITGIKILEEKREGAESFKEFDMAIYSKSVFGMFGGKAEYVSLLCHESLAGVIIDRFGQDVVFLKRDCGFFEINVSVVLSSQFYSWIFGFGDRMKIVSPQKAKDGFLEQLEKTRKCYN